MILSIDSSLGTAVAIVTHEGQVLSDLSSTDPRAHAETIGPLIEEACHQAGVNANQVSAVVMGIGPGPFTGLRVGMAAAQTFAWARGVPLWPMVSHDACVRDSHSPLLVWTDAKRREIAYSVYVPGAEGSHRVHGPALARREDLSEVVASWPQVTVVECTQLSAANLARAALQLLSRGESFPGPEALYLRPPDVTMPS